MSDLPTLAKAKKPKPTKATQKQNTSPPQTEQTTAPPKIQELSLALPILTGQVFGYASNRVGLRLNAQQKETLLRIWQALEAKDEELENGQRVKNGPTAILWLIEQAKQNLSS